MGPVPPLTLLVPSDSIHSLRPSIGPTDASDSTLKLKYGITAERTVARVFEDPNGDNSWESKSDGRTGKTIWDDTVGSHSHNEEYKDIVKSVSCNSLRKQDIKSDSGALSEEPIVRIPDQVTSDRSPAYPILTRAPLQPNPIAQAGYPACLLSQVHVQYRQHTVVQRDAAKPATSIPKSPSAPCIQRKSSITWNRPTGVRERLELARARAVERLAAKGQLHPDQTCDKVKADIARRASESAASNTVNTQRMANLPTPPPEPAAQCIRAKQHTRETSNAKTSKQRLPTTVKARPSNLLIPDLPLKPVLEISPTVQNRESDGQIKQFGEGGSNRNPGTKSPSSQVAKPNRSALQTHQLPRDDCESSSLLSQSHPIPTTQTTPRKPALVKKVVGYCEGFKPFVVVQRFPAGGGSLPAQASLESLEESGKEREKAESEDYVQVQKKNQDTDIGHDSQGQNKRVLDGTDLCSSPSVGSQAKKEPVTNICNSARNLEYPDSAVDQPHPTDSHMRRNSIAAQSFSGPSSLSIHLRLQSLSSLTEISSTQSAHREQELSDDRHAGGMPHTPVPGPLFPCATKRTPFPRDLTPKLIAALKVERKVNLPCVTKEEIMWVDLDYEVPPEYDPYNVDERGGEGWNRYFGSVDEDEEEKKRRRRVCPEGPVTTAIWERNEVW